MLTHRGRVRHANEDACAALLEAGAFVVCDGMGGAAGGEVASHLATQAFLNSLSLSKAASPGRDIARQVAVSDIRARLREAIRAANHAVFERAQRSRALHGMGTTLVAIVLHNAPAPLDHAEPSRNGQADRPAQTLWLTHVGDSRCYRLRSGTLELLTQDHSLVEEQVRAGLISPSQAADSPHRNIITRAIGTYPTVEPDIAAHATAPGDLYLLASDGLTRELDDTDIARILIQTHTAGSALESCQALVEAAIKSGGRDNITVVLVACT